MVGTSGTAAMQLNANYTRKPQPEMKNQIRLNQKASYHCFNNSTAYFINIILISCVLFCAQNRSHIPHSLESELYEELTFLYTSVHYAHFDAKLYASNFLA